MSEGRSLVSILIPVLNEEPNVERAYAAVVAEFARLGPAYDFEILFTDNHSTDRTFELLHGLAARDRRVRVIRFSRNYGYQRSILVGYLNAHGDCAIQLDCDLQDPPALIPDMLREWRNGAAVVYGVRRSRQESRLVETVRRTFYRALQALSEDDLPLDAGDFRLVDRCILDELRRIDDSTPYLRGLISSMGFRQVGLPYDRAARTAGESKFPVGALVRLAVDGVLNHSLLPLRLASFVSFLVGAVTLLSIGVYIAGRFILGRDWPPGFATTTVLLLLSITLNALFLGIVGEYLGRIFVQVKRRPLVIVEHRLNVDDIRVRAAGVEGGPAHQGARALPYSSHTPARDLFRP